MYSYPFPLFTPSSSSLFPPPSSLLLPSPLLLASFLSTPSSFLPRLSCRGARERGYSPLSSPPSTLHPCSPSSLLTPAHQGKIKSLQRPVLRQCSYKSPTSLIMNIITRQHQTLESVSVPQQLSERGCPFITDAIISQTQAQQPWMEEYK